LAALVQGEIAMKRNAMLVSVLIGRLGLCGILLLTIGWPGAATASPETGTAFSGSACRQHDLFTPADPVAGAPTVARRGVQANTPTPTPTATTCRVVSLRGTVFNDANRNGIAEVGPEGGLAGAILTLYDATGTPIGSYTTGDNGWFNFPNLTPGDYTLVETNPANHGSTTPDSVTVTLRPTLSNCLKYVNFGDAPQGSLPLCMTCRDEILFHSNRNGNWEIYKKTGLQASADEINLTQHRANDFDPSYNPATDQIAFQSDRDGNWEIYRIKGDGTGLLRLTNNRFQDTNPTWLSLCAQTGKIAFQSNRDGNWEIYVMDADGRNQRRLTNHPATDINPFWSGDGQEIVFQSNRAVAGSGSANWNLWAIKPDGNGLRRLTNGHKDGSDSVDPVWSPDNQWIAFRGKPQGSNTWELYRIRADGSNQTRLTNGNLDILSPTWSPDSARIAFQGRQGHTWHIFWVSADGSELTQVTPNSPAPGQEQAQADMTYQGETPAWGCDAVSLIFHSSQAGNAELYLAQPGMVAYELQRLTRNPAEDAYAQWSPWSDATARAPLAQTLGGNVGTVAGIGETTTLCLLALALVLVLGGGGWLLLKRRVA